MLLLDKWISNEKSVGWDPYDITDKIGVKGYKAVTPYRKINFIISQLLNTYAPTFGRRFLRIPKVFNAKAMALLSSSYSNLYSVTGRKHFLNKAVNHAEWLINNPSNTFQGLSWGYPFDWLTRKLIPAGTPSSVVTSTVGDAFWKLYKELNSIKYLKLCEEIAIFFSNELNRTFKDKNSLCFSYTPIDDFEVHNANLFVAEFLIKVGLELKNDSLVDLGKKATNFSLSEIKDDGSLCYWSNAQKHKYSGNKCMQDIYHSGFEIRMLQSIGEYLGNTNILQKAKEYFEFFIDNFFENNIPRNLHFSPYFREIHGSAEAILSKSIFTNNWVEDHYGLKDTINWVIQNFQTTYGYFIFGFRYNKFLRKVVRIKIPYMRWGQAWMMRSLTEALLINNQTSRK